MSSNRETERDLVTGYVSAGMVGDGKSLQAVYGYQEIAAWAGKQSPVMNISSDGTRREESQAGNTSVIFYLNADIFVLYESGTWTADEAEDRLDLIEKEFYDLLTANRTSARRYAYEGRSRTGSVQVGGEEYRRERIPFSVTLYNG